MAPTGCMLICSLYCIQHAHSSSVLLFWKMHHWKSPAGATDAQPQSQSLHVRYEVEQKEEENYNLPCLYIIAFNNQNEHGKS